MKGKIVSWMVCAFILLGILSLCISNVVISADNNPVMPMASKPSVQDGYWNNTTTWGGSIPIILDDVSIGHNVTIALAYEECHNLTITSGGQLNMTTNQLNVSGDWDSSAGIYNFVTPTIRFTNNASLTSGYIDELTAYFYNITIDDDKELQINNNLVYEGVLNIGSGSARIYNVSNYISCVSPSAITSPVQLGNNESLDILRFQYSTASVNRNNIGDDQIFSSDVWCRDTGTSIMTLNGNLTCDTLNITTTTMFGSLTLDTSANNYNVTCEKLELGLDFFVWGTLKCRNSLIDIGSGGVRLNTGAILDGDTALIQCDGDFENGIDPTSDSTSHYTYDTSELQFTDNATYVGSVVEGYNITVDEGKILTLTDQYNGSATWYGVLEVNGKLITGTSWGDRIKTGFGNDLYEPLKVGVNGDLSEANIRLHDESAGSSSHIIPSATYESLGIYSSVDSTYTLKGDITILKGFNITPNPSSFFITLTVDTSVNNYNVTCDNLHLGSNGFLTVGELKCRDSTIDVGSGGITLDSYGKLDGDTALIKCGGNFTAPDSFPNDFIVDNSTLQFTDNGTYRAENVQAFNLVIDEGKTLIIDDIYNGSARWSGTMWVNGTLDTTTQNKGSPHRQQITTDFYGHFIPDILFVGENGDMSKANITIYGRPHTYYNIPEATYNTIKLYMTDSNWIGHGEFHLTGDIEILDRLWLLGNQYGDVELFTQGYNITSPELRVITATDNVTIHLNSSIIDVEEFVIAGDGLVYAENSTIYCSERWINADDSFDEGNSNVIFDGIIDQEIIHFNNVFYGLGVSNTDGVVTFMNNTNITNAVFIPDVVVELNDDMTVGVLYCDQVTIRSTDLNVDRYLFSPFGQRNITDTTFNKVILVPQLTAGEIATPILISIIPILILVAIISKFIMGTKDVTEGWMK